MNIHDIIRLGKTLESTNNAAHDLWTWLPSYKRAQRLYGDYAYEKMPSMADVMSEAAIFIANKLDGNAEECVEFAAQLFSDDEES